MKWPCAYDILKIYKLIGPRIYLKKKKTVDLTKHRELMEILRPLSPNLESLGEQGKRSAVDDRISTRVNGRMVVFAGLECTMMSRGRD